MFRQISRRRQSVEEDRHGHQHHELWKSYSAKPATRFRIIFAQRRYNSKRQTSPCSITFPTAVRMGIYSSYFEGGGLTISGNKIFREHPTALQYTCHSIRAE